MTLWAEAPPDLDLGAWKRDARAAGTHLRVGSDFDLEGRATPALRLGFGRFTEREFARALRSLARTMPRAYHRAR